MSVSQRAAAVALTAVSLLPVTIAATDAAPAVAAVPAAFTAAPHHSHHWWHCHTRSRPCAKAPAKKPAMSASAKRARVVAAAKRYLGHPYSYGKLDCSGLTQRAFAAAGVRLPRTAAAQASRGHATRYPRPGDLLVYRTNGRVTHVGVVTLTKGRAVLESIVSPHTGDVVKRQKPYKAYEVRALLA